MLTKGAAHMLDDAIIRYCAPTLAGIKTGNVFSVHGLREGIIDEIRSVNRVLIKKGLRIIPVKETQKYTLIYLYRPARLRKDLDCPEAMSILSGKGYKVKSPEQCLVQLVKHLREDKDFPHEIGLFLGYPPYDVKCFMKDPCDGVKCAGCWKAYGDREEACRTFAKYNKCTDIYIKEASKGKTLEELMVAEACG